MLISICRRATTALFAGIIAGLPTHYTGVSALPNLAAAWAAFTAGTSSTTTNSIESRQTCFLLFSSLAEITCMFTFCIRNNRRYIGRRMHSMVIYVCVCVCVQVYWYVCSIVLLHPWWIVCCWWCSFHCSTTECPMNWMKKGEKRRYSLVSRRNGL